MSDTNNVLSIVSLKKYFPVGKGSLFSKQKKWLRANENVTLSIRKGETFALVGESGCGKSTLGRTLLQLYRPTFGEMIYRGETLCSFLPSYLFKTLKTAKIYHALYQKSDRTEREEEKLRKSARIFGGFLTLRAEGFEETASLLLKRFTLLSRRAESQQQIEIDKRLEEIKKENEENAEFQKWEEFLDDGIDLSQLLEKELRALRKNLQIIFQDPYSSLNPRMTVGQMIEEGVATHQFYKRGTPQMQEYVLSVMKSCGLQPYMLHRYPHQFSGGQRQRVCIARALAVRPQFVVCDECVSALDVSIQSQILNLLADLKEKEGLTYLFISHDLSVVRHVSDRVAVMYLGEISETGETEEIFNNPRHPYTIALLSAVPSASSQETSSERILLQGHMPSPVSPPSGCKFHTRCFMAQEICQRNPAPLVEVEKGHFVACHFATVSTAQKRAIAKKQGSNAQKERLKEKEN